MAGDDKSTDQTALRGNPSFVWRAGQERRLAMVARAVTLEGQRVLDVGCGVGMYTAAFTRGARMPSALNGNGPRL